MRETVILEVHIQREHSGAVYSKHVPRDASDLDVLRTWPTEGIPEVAFALLTEAVRREAVLDAILWVGSHPENRQRWREGDQQEAILADLSPRLCEVIRQTTCRLSATALREALDQVTKESPLEDDRVGTS